MKTKLETGKTGEVLAAEYLQRNGYKVLRKNFRTKLGEIDIVASDHGVICFVEVRTRRGLLGQELALESVDSRKQQRLSRLAVSFLKQSGGLDRSARFDVVVVAFSEEGSAIRLIKDAFPVAARYA